MEEDARALAGEAAEEELRGRADAAARGEDEREQRGAVGGGEAGGVVLVVVLRLLGRLDERLHGGAGAHAGGSVWVHHVHVRGDGLAGGRDDAVGVNPQVRAVVEPRHLHAAGAVVSAGSTVFEEAA